MARSARGGRRKHLHRLRAARVVLLPAGPVARPVHRPEVGRVLQRARARRGLADGLHVPPVVRAPVVAPKHVRLPIVGTQRGDHSKPTVHSHRVPESEPRGAVGCLQALRELPVRGVARPRVHPVPRALKDVGGPSLRVAPKGADDRRAPREPDRVAKVVPRGGLTALRDAPRRVRARRRLARRHEVPLRPVRLPARAGRRVALVECDLPGERV